MPGCLLPKIPNLARNFIPIAFEPNGAIIYINCRRRFMLAHLIDFDVVLLQPGLDRIATVLKRSFALTSFLAG